VTYHELSHGYFELGDSHFKVFDLFSDSLGDSHFKVFDLFSDSSIDEALKVGCSAIGMFSNKFEFAEAPLCHI
jgi:hypothetical protein